MLPNPDPNKKYSSKEANDNDERRRTRRANRAESSYDSNDNDNNVDNHENNAANVDQIPPLNLNSSPSGIATQPLTSAGFGTALDKPTSISSSLTRVATQPTASAGFGTPLDKSGTSSSSQYKKSSDSSAPVPSNGGINAISTNANNAFAPEDFQPRYSFLSVADQPTLVGLYAPLTEPGPSSSITRYQVPTAAEPSTSSPATSAVYGPHPGMSAQGSRDGNPGNNFGTSQGNSNEIVEIEFIAPSGEFGVWPLDFGMMTPEDEDEVDFYQFAQLQMLLNNCYLDVTETNNTVSVVNATTSPLQDDDDDHVELSPTFMADSYVQTDLDDDYGMGLIPDSYNDDAEDDLFVSSFDDVEYEDEDLS